MKKKFLFVTVFCLSAILVTAQTDEKRGFQLSFISPFGTNGMHSHLVTNAISFNILGGHSYGNTAFEFGGLYNVNTQFTKGFQFAGISNYSGDAQNAVQFAGVTNIAMAGTTPFQFAGVVNVADGVRGLQFAGMTNIAKEVSGLQFAGVSNHARNVKGVQFAGGMNIAKDVSGIQFAGIVNVAGKIRGVQFGLINYADECEGVPLGLINIVRKGGKREFEIAFSEAVHTAISFKLGTNRFYTIFSGGINYINPTVEYAAGLGFGTHIDWKKAWGNQIEVIGYTLTEEGSFTHDINMLTQLKFTVSKEIARYFKVFVGPVLNMTISKYVDPETGALGSSLAPWSMWKNDSENIRLNSWIGFSAGVRF